LARVHHGDEATAGITVHQLLQQTSGIPVTTGRPILDSARVLIIITTQMRAARTQLGSADRWKPMAASSQRRSQTKVIEERMAISRAATTLHRQSPLTRRRPASPVLMTRARGNEDLGPPCLGTSAPDPPGVGERA
jgi:hypothetical protein